VPRRLTQEQLAETIRAIYSAPPLDQTWEDFARKVNPS
jgi:hypothetical protein